MSDVNDITANSNIYNFSMTAIQNAIDEANNSGDTATANKLQEEASALSAVYEAEKQLDEQILKDFHTGNGSGSSSSSSGDNSSGVTSSNSSSSSAQGGIFGLFQ